VTDDIVTRLRFEYASCECSGTGWDCDRCESGKDAVNEIERLRKELGLVLAEYQRLEMRHRKAVRR
jgi:hypothetical protein